MIRFMENTVNPNICPICSEKSISRCRCNIGNRTCKNGHNWFVKDNNYYIGTGHNNDGILFKK